MEFEVIVSLLSLVALEAVLGIDNRRALGWKFRRAIFTSLWHFPCWWMYSRCA
ncbi:hypothetical protein L0663_02245 [Dyadobacter sp. CY107]|uniref:hypothetical protein n=1 Tax=Dyadobacter fanqingshengii TaxID=2906443 RepID=UPI001F1C5D5B|nr:hypothetical protein [Dyadobacter fanqingshengii]MCF2502184.1 hypothetical protein [Dyadobacter fanqingshengii]